jgi:hypothetical protein
MVWLAAANSPADDSDDRPAFVRQLNHQRASGRMESS